MKVVWPLALGGRDQTMGILFTPNFFQKLIPSGTPAIVFVSESDFSPSLRVPGCGGYHAVQFVKGASMHQKQPPAKVAF